MPILKLWLQSLKKPDGVNHSGAIYEGILEPLAAEPEAQGRTYCELIDVPTQNPPQTLDERLEPIRHQYEGRLAGIELLLGLAKFLRIGELGPETVVILAIARTYDKLEVPGQSILVLRCGPTASPYLTSYDLAEIHAGPLKVLVFTP
ncbi:hypothetical protein KW786_03365 [Candidatus Parcubacteria bacterium]|nr:hypothetical protein [Candidatus Parcubacteria bacterium]